MAKKINLSFGKVGVQKTVLAKKLPGYEWTKVLPSKGFPWKQTLTIDPDGVVEVQMHLMWPRIGWKKWQKPVYFRVTDPENLDLETAI